MENAHKFREKILRGEVCLGTAITFSDPAITEALCNIFDFVWIDAEHAPFSLETVQAHVMATKGRDTAPLVRVSWNDPALIKPLLDIGVAGVIVPMIGTAEDARRAVAACRYPPEGIRGFGPRRASNYGRIPARDFCRQANETILTIVQIEQNEAIQNLDSILAVPGLSGIAVGPMDLAASMGHPGDPDHPDVEAATEAILAKARQAGVFAGIAGGEDPGWCVHWVSKGAQWVQMGADFTLVLRAAEQVAAQARATISERGK